MVKYCTWRNYSCNSYLCCNFCKKSCPDRCKEDCNHCKYLLSEQPKEIGYRPTKKEELKSESAKPGANTSVSNSNILDEKEIAKRAARKARREARKKRRLENGNS